MPKGTKYRSRFKAPVVAHNDYIVLRGEAAERVAEDYNLGSLDEIGSDRDDFREVHCENVRGALCAMHDSGKVYAARRLLIALRDIADTAATPGRNPYLRAMIADAIAEAGRLAGEA